MSAAFAILWRGGGSLLSLSTVVPYRRIGTSELQFVCAMDGLAMVYAPCAVWSCGGCV